MLNKIQKRIVFEMPFNTIVSASPGTGKTKTLVARAECKLGTIPKHKCLALITYTNAGADEIESRLISHTDNVFIGTIHRFCLEYILRPFGWLYNYEPPKVISFDDLNEFVETIQEIDLGNSPIDELGKIKKRLSGEIDYSIDWPHSVSLDSIAELYYDYLSTKKLIDFNEILYRAYKIVSQNSFVANSLANKFYEISIDEFQDTNIFQYEIFRLINKFGISTFFMVGDEKQRIYGFAGAIESAFEKASIDFGSEIEVLETTYRSTTNIINAFSKLFDSHPQLINESVYKDIDLSLTISKTDNSSNSSYIESCIKHLLNNNIGLSEIAILTTNWMEAFIISRHIRQRYHTVGLGALPHRSVNNSTFTLLRSLCKFYHEPSISKLRAIRRYIELHILENNLSFSEKEINYSVNYLITLFNDQSFKTGLIQSLCSIEKIFEKIFKTSNTVFKEIIDLIDYEESLMWDFEKYSKTLSGIGGITINTIHQSKGLEYSAVILNNINTGRLPYQQWERQSRSFMGLTKDNLESGRTLFYVGISRAKLMLIITHNWNPSLFLKIIE
jgi:DNA helicase-2/ATP-dependent DNA helicase PcrA